VWVTPDLQGKLTQQVVLKDARDWPQSSDHVPVCVELAV
jgi:exodeoxyribonuclease-3